jgi:hypothetical protein
VRDNRTEFIVKYSGSNESEYVSIAMDDKKEYIDSIKDFVESVYKKNIGEKTDRNDAKFKPVAKGPSALITIFKKSLYVFIIMFSFNVLYLNNKVDAMAYPYSVEQTIMTKVDFKSLMDVTNIPDAVFAGGNSAVEFLKRTPACYNSGVQSCF